MSYALLCHNCNESSILADCLIPGMCPKCGIAINSCTINKVNDDTDKPIEGPRPTVIAFFEGV